jgi:hypothetical protein
MYCQGFFQDRSLPENTHLVGWAALVDALGVCAPVRRPSCVASYHVHGSTQRDDYWTIYDKRYTPGKELVDQLLFAMKHEDLDLLVLKRVLAVFPKEALENFIRKFPTSRYARRVWFFYEYLLNQELDIPDASKMTAVEAQEPKIYITTNGELSKRHRVKNNLLGNQYFCPVIRRTKSLQGLLGKDFYQQVQDIVGHVSNQLIARAASFLLLADSRASFEIEGERPARNRVARWGRAVLQSGKNDLTLEELLRLQSLLIEDTRFVQLGLRADGVFLGERLQDGDPLPEFIGARPLDLHDLMQGLIQANKRMSASKIDPILQAAAIAFGFVYIHPFQDGNGRLHRCLIHHVLAERQFTPPGVVFPVSSVMLEQIDVYRNTLQQHSAPLMNCIDWIPTPEGNVKVLNDTADLYRFFDCTEEALFLMQCVQRTIEEDFPREVAYLQRHDQAMRRIMEHVEMPDTLVENFILFVRQNDGILPKKRRKDLFSQLTDEELAFMENVVQQAFEGFSPNKGK